MAILELIRDPTMNGATLGRLAIDGTFECFTLEDVVREVEGQPVTDWKVPKETAIPTGRYQVILTKSQRFGYLTPEVLNVPGFRGIRIHPGNTSADTEGCILVGQQRGVAMVLNSQAAFHALMAKLQKIILTAEVWMEVSAA